MTLDEMTSCMLEATANDPATLIPDAFKRANGRVYQYGQTMMATAQILTGWLAGKTPEVADYEKLLAITQSHPEQAAGLDYSLTIEGIAARARDFVAIAPEIIALCEEMGFTDQGAMLETLCQRDFPADALEFLTNHAEESPRHALLIRALIEKVANQHTG